MSCAFEALVTETPVTVIDFETTGLTAGPDRVVEVAVTRIEPGGSPILVLDTLVNPERSIGATEIHSISDRDVRNAPVFRDIARPLLEALSGSIVTAFNVYFDMRFLRAELARVGVQEEPPHLCLMYLRPLLGLGARADLSSTCNALGVPIPDNAHTAADDAIASAKLVQLYRSRMAELGIHRFGDLCQLGGYKFLQSLSFSPIQSSLVNDLPPAGHICSRSGYATQAVEAKPTRSQSLSMDGRTAAHLYADALKTVISDLVISESELRYLTRLQQMLPLKKETIRSLHARIFAQAIVSFTEDGRIDTKEAKMLARLHSCLQTLGWAPGM